MLLALGTMLVSCWLLRWLDSGSLRAPAAPSCCHSCKTPDVLAAVGKVLLCGEGIDRKASRCSFLKSLACCIEVKSPSNKPLSPDGLNGEWPSYLGPASWRDSVTAVFPLPRPGPWQEHRPTSWNGSAWSAVSRVTTFRFLVDWAVDIYTLCYIEAVKQGWISC